MVGPAERGGAAAAVPGGGAGGGTGSTRVNSPRHDDARLLEPKGELVGAQGTLV